MSASTTSSLGEVSVYEELGKSKICRYNTTDLRKLTINFHERGGGVVTSEQDVDQNNSKSLNVDDEDEDEDIFLTGAIYR